MAGKIEQALDTIVDSREHKVFVIQSSPGIGLLTMLNDLSAKKNRPIKTVNAVYLEETTSASNGFNIDLANIARTTAAGSVLIFTDVSAVSDLLERAIVDFASSRLVMGIDGSVEASVPDGTTIVLQTIDVLLTHTSSKQFVHFNFTASDAVQDIVVENNKYITAWNKLRDRLIADRDHDVTKGVIEGTHVTKHAKEILEFMSSIEDEIGIVPNA